MFSQKTLIKAGTILSVYCLLCFSIFDITIAHSAVTKKCQIKGIPQKIEKYLENRPLLLARNISGKWIALDYVITEKDVVAAYKCISEEMLHIYKKSKLEVALNFRNWLRVNKISFYAPANDFGWGNVYVNRIADKYKENKYISSFDKGSVIVKESFVFDINGTISVGPLFYMMKMEKRFNKASNDWKFVEVDLDGTHVETVRSNPAATQNCIGCHGKRSNSDFLYFIKSNLNSPSLLPKQHPFTIPSANY